MLTPKQLEEKRFPLAKCYQKGYYVKDVDELLDELTVDYAALYQENADLKAKIKVLASFVSQQMERTQAEYGSRKPEKPEETKEPVMESVEEPVSV